MIYITYMIEVAGILGEISWVWVEILMMTVLVIIVATKQQGLVIVLVCVSSPEFERLRDHVKTLSCMRRIRVV